MNSRNDIEQKAKDELAAIHLGTTLCVDEHEENIFGVGYVLGYRANRSLSELEEWLRKKTWGFEQNLFSGIEVTEILTKIQELKI